MIQKIDNSAFRGNGPIKILYPGLHKNQQDTGIGSIGRIDYAHFSGSHTIPMHPHINDEILSYFRGGKIIHTDSEGFNASITQNKLMLMKAGKLFYHEEQMIDIGEPMEGLQIFIRPAKKDLTPSVIFRDLEDAHSLNEWRLLASPFEDSPLFFSSQTWIYDIKIDSAKVFSLPTFHQMDLTLLLHVFRGSVKVNNTLQLRKQDSILLNSADSISILANTNAELVLFATNENAEIYKDGMYSGNKL